MNIKKLSLFLVLAHAGIQSEKLSPGVERYLRDFFAYYHADLSRTQLAVQSPVGNESGSTLYYAEPASGKVLAYIDRNARIAYIPQDIIEDIKTHGTLSKGQEYLLLYTVGIVLCSKKNHPEERSFKARALDELKTGVFSVALAGFAGSCYALWASHNEAYLKGVSYWSLEGVDGRPIYLRNLTDTPYDHMRAYDQKVAIFLLKMGVACLGLRVVLGIASSYLDEQEEYPDIYQRAATFADTTLAQKPSSKEKDNGTAQK